MTDKRKTIQAIETIEEGKQPIPQPLEPEKELSELDLEGVAGANCRYSKPD